MGRSSYTEALNGRKGRILHGIEVGNLADLSSKGMAYTKGYANWQSGFAIMYVHNRNVQVDLIYIEKDGTFVVAGKRYGRPR
jgi:hypothetical protein